MNYSTPTILAFIATVAIWVVAGSLFVSFKGSILQDTADQTLVACTADAKQCPDGSWVGRTGPHCEFVCPTSAKTL